MITAFVRKIWNDHYLYNILKHIAKCKAPGMLMLSIYKNEVKMLSIYKNEVNLVE